MGRQLLLLTVGFLLTSVLGGVLGYVFQNRTWRQQERSKLLEAERKAARTVFEELSALMDKRLYRMRHVNWALARSQRAKEPTDLEDHMAKLRLSLYEWNDSLHRNLALVLSYFGNEMRIYLEETIYEEFRRIQAKLERAYRESHYGDGSSIRTEELARELYVLGTYVYSLNVGMVLRIQEGRVGRFNPSTPSGDPQMRRHSRQRWEDPQDYPLWPGAYFGVAGSTGAISRGPDVQYVQERLIESGWQDVDVGKVEADGHFGEITAAAVRAFQVANGLTGDGRVGRNTWSALTMRSRRQARLVTRRPRR